MGEVDFSPQVARLQQTKDTWQKIVCRLRGNPVSSSLIKRKAKHCGVLRPLSRSLAKATREMRTAKKKWEEAKSQSPVLCQEFLKVVTKKMSKREKKDEETACRRSIQNDNQVKAHRILKHTLKKQSGELVNKVQVKSATGTVECCTQETVEQTLMEALTGRFALTNQTPCVQEPLKSLLGRGDTEATQQILDGTFACPDDVDEGS